MAQEDIIAGLRNAMDRGATLEQAVQSFINAGYNPIEVKQAAQALTQGATTIINHDTQQLQSSTNNYQRSIQRQLTRQEIKKLPIFQQQKNKRSDKTLITIIILILVLLILTGALIYVIFYGKEVISSLFT